MASPDEQMQGILDSAVNDLFKDNPDDAPPDRPAALAPDPVVEDEVDAVPEDSAEPAEEPDDEPVEVESDQDDNAEPVGDADSVEDSFIQQGDDGPQLYMGQSDEGEDIYESADEVFGDTKFKIKAAGAEHEVTFAEMRQGYQRQVDYTQSKAKLAEQERGLAPYAGLATLFQQDNNFRDLVADYVSDARTASVSDSDINDALEEGDTAKARALIEKKNELANRRSKLESANRVQQQQQQMQWEEHHRVAAEVIPDYNTNISRIKDYLKSEGFDDQNIAGLEYLPPQLQKVFFTAAMASGKLPSSVKSPTSTAKRALQGKRRQIVRRPPKAAKSGPVRSGSESTAQVRRAKAKFKKAHQTGSIFDMADAVAEVLPDDF